MASEFGASGGRHQVDDHPVLDAGERPARPRRLDADAGLGVLDHLPGGLGQQPLEVRQVLLDVVTVGPVQLGA